MALRDITPFRPFGAATANPELALQKQILILTAAIVALNVGLAPARAAPAGEGSTTANDSSTTADDANQIDPNTGLRKSFEQRHPEPKFVMPATRAPDSTQDSSQSDDSLSIDGGSASHVNVLKVRQGYGFCRLIDTQNKVAYYSDVFAGNPNLDTQPRDLAFFSYIKTTYSNLPVSIQPECQYSQFDPDFVMAQYLKDNAFQKILENFSVKMTSWRP